MIVRVWRGEAAPPQAAAYAQHFAERVAPALAQLAGHRGAVLLRRDTAAGTEFLALTLWESLAAVQAFAGDDIEVAVVEPEAQVVLRAFDRIVRHYELAYGGFPAWALPGASS